MDLTTKSAIRIVLLSSLFVGIGYFAFFADLSRERPTAETKSPAEMKSGRAAEPGGRFTESPAVSAGERGRENAGNSAQKRENDLVRKAAGTSAQITAMRIPETQSSVEKTATKGKDGAPDGAESGRHAAKHAVSSQTLILENYPKIKVVATGYYAGVKSTGKTPDHPEYGITFSGVKVRRAVYSTIAADPAVFPLGTILYIPGYGFGVVADTGSAIKGKKIDLYFETLEDVYNEWGKRLVDVYIIQKGKGRVTEEMLDRLNRSDVYVMNPSG